MMAWRARIEERSFSILGRIGGDATASSPCITGFHFFFQYPRSDRRRCNWFVGFVLLAVVLPFSILGRIGGDATGQFRSRPPPASRPFSILGRIGGDATIHCTGSGYAGRPFQYPRSDRRRCNGEDPSAETAEPRRFQYPRSDRRRCNSFGLEQEEGENDLSVSSVGSEAMQLVNFGQDRRQRLALSVSSVGSEAMQQMKMKKVGGLRLAFSILGRIGGDATGIQRCRACGDLSLSVSSVGSEAMQPAPDAQRSSTVDLPFSILGRIGGDATSSSPEPGCEFRSSFQYPRSDRRRCNSSRALLNRSSSAPFSILGRIGGDATRRRPRGWVDDSIFQYPRSDRRRCNTLGRRT